MVHGNFSPQYPRRHSIIYNTPMIKLENRSEFGLKKIHTKQCHPFKIVWYIVNERLKKTVGKILLSILSPFLIKPQSPKLCFHHNSNWQKWLISFSHGQSMGWVFRWNQPPFNKVSLKITYIKLKWNLLGANKLNPMSHITVYARVMKWTVQPSGVFHQICHLVFSLGSVILTLVK